LLLLLLLRTLFVVLGVEDPAPAVQSSRGTELRHGRGRVGPYGIVGRLLEYMMVKLMRIGTPLTRMFTSLVGTELRTLSYAMIHAASV
jgi:hypothetical protein